MGLNEELAAINSKLSGLDTSIDAVTTALTTAQYPVGIPSGATPFTAVSAVITGLTYITVKAGTAGKSMYITQILAVNKTTTEDQALNIQVGTTNIKAVVPCQDIDGLTANQQGVVFVPPLVTTAAKALRAGGMISGVGDVYCMVNGYLEA